MMTVEFLLHRSLTDKNPIIVKRERDFSRSFMSLTPYQRCSGKEQIWKKFCGISAILRMKDVWPSKTTLTSMKISLHQQRNTTVNSEPTQSRPFRRGKRSVFSLITRSWRVGCLSKLLKRHGILATYGSLRKQSFSKVHTFLRSFF